MDEDIYFNEFANRGDHAALGKIILHDQEPFAFTDAAYTYAKYLKSVNIDPERQKIIDHSLPETLITGALQSGMQPIFCHSELNSPDIKFLVDKCLAIECYYWYHAMISRDWLRHWQHHPDILPRDRSDASHRFILYSRETNGTRRYRKKFLDLLEPYRNQIFCGQEQKISISADHSARINVRDSNISSIHVILETLFETPKIHLTEKVFKPMVMSQPFFLLAGPGSLEYLRNYGFQTFGEFWDESYDFVFDHEVRMMKIKQEIEKIMFLPTEKFRNLYRSMMPVIEHNRRHFFSQEFQDYCIKEMENNFQSALNLQQENRMLYPGGSQAQQLAKLAERETFIGPLWPKNITSFLNSKYLQVSRENIIETYPILSRYLD